VNGTFQERESKMKTNMSKDYLRRFAGFAEQVYETR
jgi:hypothetical protein